MKTKEVRLIVEVNNGCVDVIYGDAPPKDVKFKFIVRDMDNISAGDEDPIPKQFKPEQQYWSC